MGNPEMVDFRLVPRHGYVGRHVFPNADFCHHPTWWWLLHLGQAPSTVLRYSPPWCHSPRMPTGLSLTYQPQKLTTQSLPDPLDLGSTGVHSGTPRKIERIPLFSGSGDRLSTPRRDQGHIPYSSCGALKDILEVRISLDLECIPG
ncbi:hypothetical protein MG293_006401 [Ovis ammon polii]|uniref:Uncharacterized protein n=1 Tax=Ovis ammon polii TaxID=230172 RepID=A0AAD4UFD5_OVIAM|nr:hypothetical protein MG293_006401 [Ovis ammon polii]